MKKPSMHAVKAEPHTHAVKAELVKPEPHTHIVKAELVDRIMLKPAAAFSQRDHYADLLGGVNSLRQGDITVRYEPRFSATGSIRRPCMDRVTVSSKHVCLKASVCGHLHAYDYARSFGVVGRLRLDTGLATKTVRFEAGSNDAEFRDNFFSAQASCLKIMSEFVAAARR